MHSMRPQVTGADASATASFQPFLLHDLLERKRLTLIIGTILLNLVVVTLLTIVPGSDWKTGLALNLVDNVFFFGFAYWYRDYPLLRLMAYGGMVGFVELLADAWLVDFTRTLDYSIGGGPLLWRSPIWMPLAWEVVTVQFAVIGLRLMRWRPGIGLLLTGLLGAINIPYYEEMAQAIHWWRYTDCRMLSGTPYYIIVGEFGIALTLAAAARGIPSGKALAIVRAGLLAGLAILACYVAAFELTERPW